MNILMTLHHSGCPFHDQEEYHEAEGMYRWALRGSETVLGEEHLDTISTVDDLASVLHDQEKYQEAETMYRRALEGRVCPGNPASRYLGDD